MKENLRYQPFKRFETDPSKGAQLWRIIDRCKARIHTVCLEKGVSEQDMLWRKAIFIADSKYNAFNLDETLSSEQAGRILSNLLRDMHEHEAAVCKTLGVPCDTEMANEA